MPNDLLDAMTEAQGTPDVPMEDAMDYTGDVNYHMKAYMIEQALRDVGAIPNPAAERDEMPYDDDLRKLIREVTLE